MVFERSSDLTYLLVLKHSRTLDWCEHIYKLPVVSPSGCTKQLRLVCYSTFSQNEQTTTRINWREYLQHCKECTRMGNLLDWLFLDL